jgi:4-cresol dehydrogenase (hydroxylating)
MSREALHDIQEIVGEKYFQSREKISLLQQDSGTFLNHPLAIVEPGTVDELRAILAVARRYKISLWPQGQGRNWGYGAAIPLDPDGIVVLLRRLNTIHHVDSDLAYAVIEPGVTYKQLYEYVSKNHPLLWIDSIDGTPNGSVLGNALERGVGPTPYGDHFGQLCGLDILLPNGDLIKTGGGREVNTFHTYRWGSGPVIDGLFSQSNFGIVVKAGIWLMPRPEHFESFFFESSDNVSLNTLIEKLRPLFLQGVLRGTIRMIIGISAVSVIDQYPNAPGLCMSPEEIEKLRKSYGFAKWSMSAGLYGSKRQIRDQKKKLRQQLKASGRIFFLSDRMVSLVERYVRFAKKSQGVFKHFLDQTLWMISGKKLSTIEMLPFVHRILKGQPTEFFVRHAYFKKQTRPDHDINPAWDHCGVTWFAPIVPNRGEDVESAVQLGESLYKKYGFECHVALMFHSSRSVVILMSIFYRRDNPDEWARADALLKDLIKTFRTENYLEYRTGPSCMSGSLDDIPAYKKFLSDIKRSIDPDGILAPGRYGVENKG